VVSHFRGALVRQGKLTPEIVSRCIAHPGLVEFY